MILSHKIRIYPNNKQKTQIEKSFGVSRFTYNWVLERFNQAQENHLPFYLYELKKEFNAIKQEAFPFVCEVSKYASQEAFLDFKDALNSFYKKSSRHKHIALRFRSKKDPVQNYYVGGDSIRIIHKDGIDKDYLKIPKMSELKLSEKVRFSGHIIGLRIKKEHNTYYAVISANVESQPVAQHKTNDIVGIDLGIKHHITLSNGLQIDYPNASKIIKRINIEQRNLSRKIHPRIKDDPTNYSNNYLKQKSKLSHLLEKLDNIKRDYERKVTSILTSNFNTICIEGLAVEPMKLNTYVAKRLQYISFNRIKNNLEYKCSKTATELIIADRLFASSKTCSNCGSIQKDLKLSTRIYKCQKCGLILDRDLNAAINLKNYVGRVTSEFKPLDLDSFIADCKKSNLKVSRFEEGR